MVQFNNIKAAIEALKANASMEEFSLRDEEIEQKDFDVFVEALRGNTALKELDLSHCNLGNIDYTGLVAALENKEGISLNLSYNEFTDGESYDIETGLISYPLQQWVNKLLGLKISSLDLSYNEMSGAVGGIIAESLKKNTRLDSLDLTGNPDISDAECAEIEQILKDNKGKRGGQLPQSNLQEMRVSATDKKKSGVSGLRF